VSGAGVGACPHPFAGECLLLAWQRRHVATSAIKAASPALDAFRLLGPPEPEYHTIHSAGFHSTEQQFLQPEGGAIRREDGAPGFHVHGGVEDGRRGGDAKIDVDDGSPCRVARFHWPSLPVRTSVQVRHEEQMQGRHVLYPLPSLQMA
jgi:hypothetical protein